MTEPPCVAPGPCWLCPVLGEVREEALRPVLVAPNSPGESQLRRAECVLQIGDVDQRPGSCLMPNQRQRPVLSRRGRQARDGGSAVPSSPQAGPSDLALRPVHIALLHIRGHDPCGKKEGKSVTAEPVSFKKLSTKLPQQQPPTVQWPHWAVCLQVPAHTRICQADTSSLSPAAPPTHWLSLLTRERSGRSSVGFSTWTFTLGFLT